MSEIIEAINKLSRSDNFSFLNLLSVVHDADKNGLDDDLFKDIVAYVISFISFNRPIIY